MHGDSEETGTMEARGHGLEPDVVGALAFDLATNCVLTSLVREAETRFGGGAGKGESGSNRGMILVLSASRSLGRKQVKRGKQRKTRRAVKANRNKE